MNKENDVNGLILDDNTISELDYLIGGIADVKIPEKNNQFEFLKRKFCLFFGQVDFQQHLLLYQVY